MAVLYHLAAPVQCVMKGWSKSNKKEKMLSCLLLGVAYLSSVWPDTPDWRAWGGAVIAHLPTPPQCISSPVDEDDQITTELSCFICQLWRVSEILQSEWLYGNTFTQFFTLKLLCLSLSAVLGLTRPLIQRRKTLRWEIKIISTPIVLPASSQSHMPDHSFSLFFWSKCFCLPDFWMLLSHISQ